MAIPTLEKVGFEADDIIATLATQGRDRGDDVIIVTGDRDSYQLVEDPHVKVLYNKRGVSDYAHSDEAGILDRTGVRPVDYVQYAALRGDNSDNLPGVPGVGEKTAAKLINERGGIDGIYEVLDELTPKLRENLAANEANVRNNVEMMELVRDVDLEFSLQDLTQGAPDTEAIKKLFDFLEFRSLWDRLAPVLGERGSAPAEALTADITVYDSPAAAAAALALAGTGSDVLALGVPESGVDGGLAFVVDGDACDVGFVKGDFFADPSVLDALRALFGPDGRPWRCTEPRLRCDGSTTHGVDVRDLAVDTRLAAYLLDPADNRLRPRCAAVPTLWHGTPGVGPARRATRSRRRRHGGCSRGRASWLAVHHLVMPVREAMANQGLLALHDDLEVPLVRVLAKMEHRGIGVDPAVLTQIRNELVSETEAKRAAVIEHAGHDFNVNSTKQLREVLFDELGLTPQKKTKTGYSTDAQSLEKMRSEHPIVENLLQYREVEKLRSTYGEGLLAEVGEGNRIRATFQQTVARTGRLSSDQPNLHNIPVRSERGRVFRTAFVAPEGHKLLIADYDQIELRCIAPCGGSGPDRGVRGRRRHHTATAAPYSTSLPRMSMSRSGRRRRWSRMVLPTAWRPTGLRSASTSRCRGVRDPRELLRGVPGREAVHGGHGRTGP